MSLVERLKPLADWPTEALPPPPPAPSLSERLAKVQPIIAATTPELIIVPFGSWLPDLPDYANPGATVAKNVVPAVNNYGPLKALQAATT